MKSSTTTTTTTTTNTPSNNSNNTNVPSFLAVPSALTVNTHHTTPQESWSIPSCLVLVDSIGRAILENKQPPISLLTESEYSEINNTVSFIRSSLSMINCEGTQCFAIMLKNIHSILLQLNVSLVELRRIPRHLLSHIVATILKNESLVKQSVDQLVSLQPIDSQRLPVHLLPNDAKDMWTKRFGEKISFVPWSMFFSAIQAYLDFNAQAYEENFRHIIDFTQDGYVSPYKLATFLKWFGPLTSSLRNLIDSVNSKIMSGFISGVEASRFLDKKSSGHYIIRFSKTYPGAFAVTFVENTNHIRHCLLYPVANGLTLQHPPDVFANLTDFVISFSSKLNTTTIYATNITATDEELTHVINLAHDLGLSVMLKPHIDLTKDPANWRGDIGSYYSDEDWATWFGYYNEIMAHYAKLSQKLGVESFSLGCELISASPRDAEWRVVAATVREHFDGVLTYAANHGGEETNKTWWDVVDIIGVDAYYPMAPDIPNPTLADLVQYWKIIQNEGVDNGEEQMTTSLHNLTVFWNKPMIFTELGYCSSLTGNPQAPASMGFMNLHFEAVFEAFADLDWFQGVFWWNWVTDPAFGGDNNYCMSPAFKPTEELLRLQYGNGYPSVQPTYPPACPCIL
eukprot:gene13313-15652_t